MIVLCNKLILIHSKPADQLSQQNVNVAGENKAF